MISPGEGQKLPVAVTGMAAHRLSGRFEDAGGEEQLSLLGHLEKARCLVHGGSHRRGDLAFSSGGLDEITGTESQLDAGPRTAGPVFSLQPVLKSQCRPDGVAGVIEGRHQAAAGGLQQRSRARSPECIAKQGLHAVRHCSESLGSLPFRQEGSVAHLREQDDAMNSLARGGSAPFAAAGDLPGVADAEHFLAHVADALVPLFRSEDMARWITSSRRASMATFSEAGSKLPVGNSPVSISWNITPRE